MDTTPLPRGEAPIHCSPIAQLQARQTRLSVPHALRACRWGPNFHPKMQVVKQTAQRPKVGGLKPQLLHLTSRTYRDAQQRGAGPESSTSSSLSVVACMRPGFTPHCIGQGGGPFPRSLPEFLLQPAHRAVHPTEDSLWGCRKQGLPSLASSLSPHPEHGARPGGRGGGRGGPPDLPSGWKFKTLQLLLGRMELQTPVDSWGFLCRRSTPSVRCSPLQEVLE